LRRHKGLYHVENVVEDLVDLTTVGPWIIPIPSGPPLFHKKIVSPKGHIAQSTESIGRIEMIMKQGPAGLSILSLPEGSILSILEKGPDLPILLLGPVGRLNLLLPEGSSTEIVENNLGHPSLLV
jgi:hypothetical protein